MNQMRDKKQGWLNRNIAGMGLASLFSDMSHEMTTAVLPTFITSLVGPAFAPQALGIVSGLSDAIASFVKIFSGWVSDKIERRKKIVVLGYAITGFFAGLTGFVANWIQALVFRAFAWFGRGLREPPRDALIVDSVPPQTYGRAFGFHRAMDTLGAVAGPLLVFFTLGVFGVKNIFLLSFVPGFLAVVSIILLVKEKQKIPEPQTFTALWSDIASLPKEFRYFLLVMFIFGIGNFNRTLLLLRAEQVLEPTNGLVIAGSLSILLYAFRNIVQALADYLVGYLSDVIGRKIPLAFFGFFLFGIMSVGLISPLPNLWFFILLFAFSGVSAAGYTALEKAYAADLLPSKLRGTGYGVLQTIDGIGDFVSSFAVGFLWSVISPTASFTYAALLSFLAAALLMFAKKRKGYGPQNDFPLRRSK
jgi:MFS family permease